jgi:amino acid adenylation domain-containing protein/FkbM family methyltransferase/non-ribosomal peptide synthase protein (TIGR01720 family)
MTYAALIEHLESFQVRYWEDEGRLRVSAPEGVLTPALIEALRTHKDALLADLAKVSDPVGPHPLSLAQERLWFLETMGGVGAAYNVAGAVRITGDLDGEALGAAFRLVQQRQPMLRMRLVDVDGSPAQVAAPADDLVTLERRVWHGDAVAALAAAHADAQVPFDITRDALVRATLHDIGPGDALLAVTMHHLISDGSSLTVLIRELTEAYRAVRAQRSPAWSPLQSHYVDYARAQREGLVHGRFDREVDYWRAQLDDAPDAITLPADGARPATATFNGSAVPVLIPAATAQAVTRLAGARGATPVMVLLAAYAHLLMRMSGQDDVVIGVPVSGRPSDGAEDLIGLFVNALPIRVHAAPEATFAALVDQVKTQVLDAMAHAEVPWEFLLEALHPQRDVSRAPIFQVSFTLQDNPVSAFDVDGLTFIDVPLPVEAAKFELSLELHTALDGGFTGVLEFNTDLFARSTAERFVERYVHVVETLATRPEAPLDGAALWLPGEVVALESAWCGPEVPFDVGTSVPEAFSEVAAARPEAEAVVLGERVVTFAELHAEARRVGAALVHLGVKAGDRVGVVVDRTPETIAHLLGVMFAGAAYVPIDPSWPEERRSSVLGTAGCTFVIDDTFVAEGSAPLPHVPPDAAAYVLFTSGSTGVPKGVVVEHRSLRHLIEALEFAVYQPLGIHSRARVSVNGALTFDTSVKQVFQLLQGRTLVLVPEDVRLDGAALLSYAEAMGLEVLDATPSQLTWLVEAGLATHPGRVRAVLAGGEALSRTLWHAMRRPGAPTLVNLYGPTECTVDATAHILGADDDAPLLGRPLPNMAVCVCDAALRPVPVGVPGELVIAGPGVARGYLGDAETTAAKFLPNPLPGLPGTRVYRTGDRGRVRPDGRLEFLGRVDDQVKVRGHRVELGEVEQGLARHEAVRAACALLTDDQRLVAAVAVDPLRSETFEGRERHTLRNGLSIVQLNRNEADFLYDEMFEKNAYLRHGVHLHDGATVLDVGSNIGMFAMFAHVRHAGLRLVCVEPNPHVRTLLDANLRLFGAAAHVFDCGIGEVEGRAEFTFYPWFSILSGLHADVDDEKAVVRSYIRHQQDMAGSDDATVDEVISAKLRPVTLPVRLRPLGDIIAESGLTGIDLLKINVEKAELEVLLGVRDDQWAMIRQIALELHDVDGRLDTTLAMLRGRGFEVTVDEDWSLEREAGTNYYLYAVRPGQGRPETPADPERIRLFTRPLVTGEAIRTAAQDHLPEYMVPDVCRVVERLPVTTHGKVDRRAIARWSWTRTGRVGGEPVRALTPVEERLAALWSLVLDMEHIGPADHFFNSGGHSLSAARLAGRVREAFGVAFTVGAVFDAPVLSDMAVHVASLTAGPVSVALHAHGWDGPLPVSFAQERLLFLEQLDGGGAAYVIAGAMELEGALDVSALRRALVDVVTRHPVLRSVFPREGATPVARLVDRQVELAQEDWSTRDIADTATAIHDWVLAQSAVAFDLTCDLPLRVTLLRVTADHHVLAVACHHVVADGWSVALFLRDLSARYRAHAGLPDADQLPVLSVGYYDYARWQREWLSGERLESDLAFWRTSLDGAAPSLDLPTDHPRPPVTTYDGQSISWMVSSATRTRVEQVARQCDATPYMVLLSVFAALLHRWSGQHDIVIGSPVAGRTVPGTDDLIGLFVNTVVMRLDLEGVSTFADLLARSRQVTRDALDHQDVPFELVVEAVRPPRRLDRHPVFQVMFALQNLPVSVLDLPGVRWTPCVVASTVARFDLSLVIDEVADGYRATFEHATALFEAETISRLRGQFDRLLAVVLDAVETPIATVGLTSADDLARIRVWNDTTRDYGAFVPVHRMVAEQARKTPDAVALVYQGTHVIYAEMMRQSRHVAAEIHRRGITPGSVVAFYTDRSPAWVVSLLGVLDAGVVFLPIDPDFPADRVRWMLEDSSAALVISQRSVWMGLVTASQTPIDTPVAFLDDIPFAGDPPHIDPATPGPDDAAYVIYTSGSTGRPKGAVNAHRGFTNLVRNFVELFDTSAASKALHFSSVSFDSSLCEVFMALVVGGTAVLAAREEILPGEPLERVLRERHVTHATIPPSALGGMMDPDLPDLQVLISAGEVCTPEVVQRWGGPRRFYNAYGPTESSVCSIVTRVRPGESTVPIGYPLRNVRVYIVDPSRKSVPVGMPGEIAIGGVGVAHGYLRRPELTAERFIEIDPYNDGHRERVYLTGDQGRFLADGKIEFLGRQDTQIKLRGYRIELGEIETALRAQASVRDCAVVVQEAPGGQKRLVAFVVSEGGPIAPRVLKEHLRMRLPEYMVPPVIVGVERIPQTTGGKRDTRALERWDVSSAPVHEEAPDGAPVSPTTHIVAGIFAEVLGRESFGPRDDFFEQGGHSLLAARVIGRVRDSLGVELTLRSLFEAPTPERLADVAVGATNAAWPAIEAASTPEERRVMSAAQRRLWFIDQLGASEAYTIVAAVRLTGTIDLPAFRSAVLSLSQRHEVLRSVYPSTDGEPFVMLSEPVPLRIARVTGDDRWSAAIAMATEDARQPFDLATGPLFRPVLYHLTGEDHLFVASMHHIVSDGWSIGVLVRDLADAYLGMTGDPPLQYGDYALWWSRTFEGTGQHRLDQQLDFWRRRLAGAATQLALPTDHPRPAVQTSRGATVSLTIPPDLVSALDALSRQTTASRFVVLLSAYMTWLSRVSGQESFLVGTPVANRRDPRLESVVGLFANTLPLRADVPADHSFLDVLTVNLARVVEDLSHPDVPFDLIVQALQPTRDLSRSPLFQVMFAWSSDLVPPLELPGLSIAPVTVGLPVAKFDLTLFMDEGANAGELSATFEYNADLFEADTVRRLVDGFVTMLRDVVARPDVPVGDLAVLSDADLATLESWNGTAAGGVSSADFPTAIDLFERQVALSPDAIAIEWDAGAMTFSALDRRANQLSRWLVSRGVTSETMVAVCLERSPELIVALLAVWKAGGAYVPVDPQYPVERRTFMVHDVGARVLLTSSALAAEADTVARLSEAPVVRTTRSSDLAYVIYTSGSTGTPKGVLIEHGGLSNYLTWAVHAYDMRGGSGAPVTGSIGFDATITSVFGPLVAGQRLILVPEGAEIDALGVRASENQDHSFWKITPSHLDAVNAGLAGRPLSGRVRHLVIGGEALGASTLRPWAESAPETMVTNEYGPTETVVGCTAFTRAAGEMPTGVVPIGRPIANTEIHVLNTRQQPVPIGAVGEIHVAGAGVARGYHARPDLTAARFVDVSIRRSDGTVAQRRCYRTGDLARWNADGQLEYLGRVDAQVKLRGHRIELGEIETVALRNHTITQAAAVVQPASHGDSRLVLYVVPSQAQQPDVAAILERLRSTLPAVMVPASVRTIDVLPLTPNGKLDRDALVGMIDSSEDTGNPAPLAGDAVSALVAEAWTAVLGAPPAGPDADFFGAGGHSLVAAQLVARVRTLCEVDLPVRAVFDHPTWRELSAAVAAARRGGDALPPLVRSTHAPTLSFGQQRLWALDQFDDTGTAYHIPAVFRLRGDLRVDALQAAWLDVVERHDVLRSCMPSPDGQPTLARVDAPPALTILESDGQAPDVMVTSVLSAPFSLATGPLVRAVLARESETSWIFGVVLHHAVSDGWSSGVLVRDLRAAYERHVGLSDQAAAPLAVQYHDWSAWQRNLLQGAVLDRLVAFWTTTLEGAPPVLALPLDHPRGARQRYDGAVVTTQIGAALQTRIQQFARDQHATVYMVLLSAFTALLSQWSRQQDVVVGTTAANRSEIGTDDVIGFFVNTLPIRLRLSDGMSTGDLVRSARLATLNALDHQALPFERLVDLVGHERNPAVSPIVQALFTYQQAGAADLTLPGVEVTPVSMPHSSAKFDLTLAVDERPDGVELFFEYRADLFDEATIRLVADRLVAGLEAMVGDAAMPVSEIPFLTAAETRQLAVWNATDRDFRDPRLLHECFETQAHLRPDAVALWCDDAAMTYGELNRRADAMAERLRSFGVGRDVLVGVCLERSFDLFVALLGILKAGGAYVPLDPEYPRQRLADMIDDAAMPVIVTTGAIVDRGVLPDTATSVTRVLVESAATAPAPTPVAFDRPQPDDLAYCIFTSGSTGRPKGATISHRAIRNRLLWMQDAHPLDASDVILHKTPISFDVSVWELFWPLMFGASIVIARPGGHRDAAYLADLVTTHRVTTMHFVPSMLQAFLEEPSTVRLSSLRRVFASGEALSWETARQGVARLGCPLHNLYGPTEAAVDVTAWTVALGPEPHTIPIGRPIANTRIHILDEQMRRVPIGVPGELYIGGVNLARGYINRPELTQERFVENPFSVEPGESVRLYRTGDLARWRSDGQLEYLGRLDSQIKLRGFRIELGEIETALRQHPAVADAAVTVVGTTRLAAYVVMARGHVLDESELREHLRSRLPEYMVPSVYMALPMLPLGPSGKLDRRALPEPDAPVTSGAPEPQTESERTMAAIWADVLGRESIGRAENFFDIGGDSIRAIQVAARARKAGLPVTPALLLEHQTIAELSAAVADRSGRDGAEGVPAEQGLLSGEVPAAPIVRWFVDLGFGAPHHFNQSVVMQTPAGLPADVVERGLRRVSDHHDALRLRSSLTRDHLMVWYGGRDDARVFRHVSLAGVPAEERHRQVEGIATELQATLDPIHGPLWRAVYVTFDANEPGRLIWAIHHLGVDGVSWSILTEDLAIVCHDLQTGREPDLGEKTHSWRQWTQSWTDAARAGALEEQKPFWMAQPYGLVQPAPTSRHVHAVTRHDRVPLAPGQRCSQDQVLTALWLAWTEVAGHAAMAVDVESHGRVSPGDSLDLSRTVGWFTAVYPLVFAPAVDASPAEVVRRTVAAVPQVGAGFGALRYLAGDAQLSAIPRSPVLFNFLGDLDAAVTGRHGFAVAAEGTGATSSARNQSPYALELVAGVSAGFLDLHWRSPVDGLGDERVAALASATIRHLGVVHPAPVPVMSVVGTQGPLIRLRSPQPDDDGVPLFLIHPAGGTVMCYGPLAQRLQMPVYGLQAPGLNEGETPVRDVETLTQHYCDVIVSAWPSGPYRIGGWSYGGIVAFDLARRLEATGRVVDLLAIFDTLAPGAMPEGEWRKSAATLMADIFGADAGVDIEELAGLTLDAQLQRVTARAIAAGVLPPEFSVADAQRAWAVFQAHRHAEETYRATPSLGHGLVFSSNLRRGDPEPTLGWYRWLRQVDVVEVPGTHLDVLRPPVVDQVADVIRAACRIRV